MNEEVLVRKLNLQGGETWRYNGQVLARSPRGVLIEALFNRDKGRAKDIPLLRGDRFVELYLTDRWYNIFEIHNGLSGPVKGWYCNVSRPAVVADGQISYVDLALDLLVYPDGRQAVLDEDEFEALELDGQTREQALAGLSALQRLFGKTGFIDLASELEIDS